MDAEADKNTHKGVNVFIPKNDNAYLKESKLLGSSLIESFKNNYQLPVTGYLQQREQGIWILKANQFPAVLIEPGFLSTQTDLEYLIKPENQHIIAENILNGIEKYAENTLTRNDNFSVSPDPAPVPESKVFPKAYVVDGKIVSVVEVKTIDPANMQSINVLKGESAGEKYGEKGVIGAVEIITKPHNIHKDTLPDKVFTKVEIEAEFPGGNEAWTRYISSKVTTAFDSLKVVDSNNYGTCLMKFIVNTDGSISHIEATTMKDTQLSDIAANAIRTGPKWIPASQNGHIVASYRLQPVSIIKAK
jgi:hypothetical protein